MSHEPHPPLGLPSRGTAGHLEIGPHPLPTGIPGFEQRPHIH
ncbi:hypothetical protein Cadr_000031341, partial [Camelus dromedarius]